MMRYLLVEYLLPYLLVVLILHDQMVLACKGSSPEVVGGSLWGGPSVVPSARWMRRAEGRDGRSGTICGSPCLCVTESDGDLLVDCSMALSASDVVKGFHDAPPPAPDEPEAVVRLVILSSELTALEDNSFGNVSFSHIHVKYNHGLARISEHAFVASHRSLRVLDLRNNNLTAFPLRGLRSFALLEFLSVDDNGLTQIPSWVSDLGALIHLSVANNRVRQLEAGALSGMHSLQFLDLHSNALADMPTSQLARLSSLRSLVLRGNPITTIPHGALFGLESLQYLDLSGTQVTQVAPSSLATPTQSPWFFSLAQTPVVELSEETFGNGSLPYWIDLTETEVSSLDELFFSPILHTMASLNLVHIDWGKPQIWINNKVLTCDCSAKWLVTNTTLLQHVSGRCNDKNINLRFLDPDYFHIFCY